MFLLEQCIFLCLHPMLTETFTLFFFFFLDIMRPYLKVSLLIFLRLLRCV